MKPCQSDRPAEAPSPERAKAIGDYLERVERWDRLRELEAELGINRD